MKTRWMIVDFKIGEALKTAAKFEGVFFRFYGSAEKIIEVAERLGYNARITDNNKIDCEENGQYYLIAY